MKRRHITLQVKISTILDYDLSKNLVTKENDKVWLTQVIEAGTPTALMDDK